MTSLTVLQPPKPGPKIKPSKSSGRRAAVLVGVHVLIAGHIAYWLVKGSAITPVEPSEAIAFSRAGVVNAGLLFFAAAIALTAVFGRFFCGWACHLVALQDGSSWLLEKLGHRPKPLRSRFLGWVPTISFLYLFIYPLYVRLAAGDPLFSGHTEMVTTEFWSRFPGWILALLTFFICGFAIIYFLGAKGFCTYACPYGAAFAGADRLSPLRIRVTDACEGCGHCTAVCTSNVRVHEEVRDFGMVMSAGCMKCMDCVSVCPKDALYYGAGPIPLLAKRRTEKPGPDAKKSFPLALWEEVLLAVAGFAGYLTFRGLYGAVPILMALGLAAVFAYIALLAARLVFKRHLAFKRWRLKRDGRWLPAGKVVFAVALVALLFWAHSATMRWTLTQAEKLYRQTVLLRAAALDPAQPLPPDTSTDVARRALSSYDFMQTYGLVSTLGVEARQAELHLVLGDLDQARERALQAMHSGVFVIDSQLVAATASARASDYAAAAQHYKEVATAEPERLNAHIGHGLMFAELGQFEAAADAFNQGLRHHPRSTELLYNHALALAYSGQLDQAASGFAEVARLQPQHWAAHENRAGILAELRQFEQAEQHLRDVVEQQTTPASINLIYARVLLELGKTEAAREQFLIARDRGDPTGEAARALATP